MYKSPGFRYPRTLHTLEYLIIILIRHIYTFFSFLMLLVRKSRQKSEKTITLEKKNIRESNDVSGSLIGQRRTPGTAYLIGFDLRLVEPRLLPAPLHQWARAIPHWRVQ